MLTADSWAEVLFMMRSSWASFTSCKMLTRRCVRNLRVRHIVVVSVFNFTPNANSINRSLKFIAKKEDERHLALKTISDMQLLKCWKVHHHHRKTESSLIPILVRLTIWTNYKWNTKNWQECYYTMNSWILFLELVLPNLPLTLTKTNCARNS